MSNYDTYSTDTQRASAGVCILIRKGFLGEIFINAAAGHILGVKIRDIDINLIAAHTPYRETAEEVTDVLDIFMDWKEKSVLYLDGDHLEKYVQIPSSWFAFKKTWEIGEETGNPDVVAVLNICAKCEVGEKISDHFIIRMEVDLEVHSDLTNLFPYSRKKMLASFLSGYKLNHWPGEAQSYLGRRKSRGMHVIAPYSRINGVEKMNFIKFNFMEWIKKIRTKMDADDMNGLWKLINKVCGGTKHRMVSHVCIGDKVISIMSAEGEIMTYFKKLYNQLERKEKRNKRFKLYHLGEDVPKIGHKALGWSLTPDEVFEIKNYKGIMKPTYPGVIDRWKKWLREKRTEIPEYMKIGRLICLSKVNKSIVDMNDIRPISVMSNEYKIIEKMLLERIKDKIWKEIPTCQRGFRAGFNCHHNIIDVKEFTKKVRQDGERRYFLMSVDITKAYDHVDRDKLLYKLKKILAEEEYAIYEELIWRTKVKLHKVELETTNGVPQGSILSPIMFDLYTADLLYEMENILGCPALGSEDRYRQALIVAYADNIVIGGSTSKLRNVENAITSWKKSHNMIVNWEKCEIILRNSNRKTLAKKVKEIKVLGVYLGWNSERDAKKKLREWVKKRIGKWKFLPFKSAKDG